MSELPEGFTLEVGETTPEQLAEIFPPAVEGDIPEGFSPEPSAPESSLERFTIGVGRGATERLQGVQQFGYELGDALNPATPTSIEAQKFYDEAQREREEFNNTPVGRTSEAKAGELVGNIAADAPIGVSGRAGSAAARFGKGMLVGGGLSATQFVEDPSERVNNVVLGTALAGAGSIALDLARVNANIINSKLKRAFQEPDLLRTYNKSKRISEESGVDFTLGQSTGSRSLLSYEDVAVKSEGSADLVISLRNKQVRQGVRRIQKAIDTIGDRNTNPEIVGKQLKKSLESTTNGLVKLRNHLWNKSMDKAKPFAEGKPIGIPNKTIDRMDAIIDELKNPLSPYPTSVVKNFEKVREKVRTSWSVDDYQSALKLWGKNARGTGQPFKDLSTADQRRFFKDLVNTLGEDIDGIIAKGGGNSKLLGYLKTARNAWKFQSSKLNELENGVLGQLLNKGGKPASAEEFYTKIISMKPSELKAIIPVIDKTDPRILNNTRVLIMKNALTKAMAGADSPESLVKMDPASFIRNLKVDKSTMEIFKGAPRKELVKTIQAIRRIADRSSVSGGGQSPLGSSVEVAGLAGGVFQGGFGLPDQVFIGRFLAKNLSPKRYAKLLMTKDGQKAVQNIAKWNKVSRDVLNASVGTLVGILNDPEI